MDAATALWLDLDDAPAIEGLRFRHPRCDDRDYEDLAQMIGRASQADGFPWFPTAHSLREEWEEDDLDEFDPRTDALVATIHEQVIGIAGQYRVFRGGRPVYQLWGHVDPEWRRHRIGTALLAWNLGNADRRAIEHDDPRPSGRPDVRSFVSETEHGTIAILSAAGLAPIRWTFLMRRRTLDDVPDAPLPEGLELRPVEPAQHRAIILADHDAFRDHWEPRDFSESSFRALFAREELRTDLWVVAWEGDEVAGSVQVWISPHENERLGVLRAWLESISVRRPWRRRGLARAMIAESLRKLRTVGIQEVMLGVDAANPTGALGLYHGLGFEIDQRAQIFGWRAPG